MRRLRNWLGWPRGSSWCLVCGVDSGPVLTFFLWLIGGCVVGSLCILLWGISRKKFGDQSNAFQPLKAENIIPEPPEGTT